jgi:HEPN domain-containing protein
MSDLNEARRMLELAERDLRAVRAMGDADAFADEIVGFLIQQAIEKSLKAWLAAVGSGYPFIHDLNKLRLLLGERGRDTSAFERLDDYTLFAVQFRYDDMGTGGHRLDRARALAESQRLFDHVSALVRPAGGAEHQPEPA